MRDDREPAHRVAAYTDAGFAVIVTVMVLELKAPDEAAFSALWPLWPTAISYVVSYLFIAVIWINNHYLMRFVGYPSLGLIWMNFVHLFLVSLLRSRQRGSRAPGSRRPRSRFTQDCSCASTSPTTCSSARFWLAQVRRWCPSGLVASPAALARRPRDLHDRHADRVRRAAPQLRPDLRRPAPSLAARGPRQSGVRVL